MINVVHVWHNDARHFKNSECWIFITNIFLCDFISILERGEFFKKCIGDFPKIFET